MEKIRTGFVARACARLSLGLLASLFLACAGARAEEITFACDTTGLGAVFCAESVKDWARLNNHTVKLVDLPRSPTRRLELYKQLFDARSDKIDVLMIDVVWPGILADFLVDLRPVARTVIGQHLPSIIANDTVDGRLVAMPWFIDVGLLFYRKDLLARYGAAVPRTWDELTRTAHAIQDGERRRGNPQFWGYAWQGRAYEGLTCNIVEWLADRDAARMVDDAGRIAIDKAAVVDVLQRARSWIGDISPPAVLAANEDGTLKAFSDGNAAFLRHWPYAWSATQKANPALRDQVGIARLPRGESAESHATLGGAQLAVSRYSRHREAAMQLVVYLTERVQQKRLTLQGGVYPTIMDLYNDPDIKALPTQAVVHDALAHAVARPSASTGAHYEELSRALVATAHRVLAEGQDAATSVNALARELAALPARREPAAGAPR